MIWPHFPLGFYFATVVALMLTGIGKGGFGTGAGGIAVPLMSMFVSPAEAAGIVLPILCAMDLFGLHAYRGTWSAKHLRALVPGALVGIALGALVFGTLPVNALRALLGIIAVAFALNRWFRVTERIATMLSARQRKPGAVAGTIWGGLSGFTSTLAHAGGPPFAIYILPQRLDKTLMVGTSVVFFLIVNYVKLVPYYFLGQLNPGNLVASLVFSPLAPIGIWLGVWLHRRVSERAFYQVSYTLLMISGVKLLWDAMGLH